MEQTQYLEYLLENSIHLRPSHQMTIVSSPTRGSVVRYDAAHPRAMNLIEKAFALCHRTLFFGDFHMRQDY